MNTPQSALREIAWPALPSASSAGLLALLFQLEQSQYWSADELAARQFQQLEHVVAHAAATVPFYRRRLAEAGVDPRAGQWRDVWSTVPLLSRRDIQVSGVALHSEQPPPQHGAVSRTSTSGSTNQPVTTLGTGVSALFWRALTLRDHLWHRRDLRASLATIRHTGDDRGLPPHGVKSDNWGAATQGTFATGPSYLLNVRSTLDEQIAWLRTIDPDYLLSYPSILASLATSLEARGQRLKKLRELRTFGEVLEPEARDTCRDSFGVKVVDMYSSQEVGYMALQCPEGEHYHLQEENLLIEILDDAGEPCRAGEIGRVVVTTLHNFAMPLLRYDIGDYAEVGPPCGCGRGLRVVNRILGRQRSLLVLPDGSRRWPVFDAGERPEELPLFFQFQVIQRGRQQIEVLAVREQPFTPDEQRRVERYMQQTLGFPFAVALTRVDAIPRSPTGKFEDFICELN